MDTLDKIVKSFVEIRFNEEKIDIDLIQDDPEFSVDNMKMAIEDNIKERIIAEVVDVKKSEIDSHTKKAVEAERE